MIRVTLSRALEEQARLEGSETNGTEINMIAEDGCCVFQGKDAGMKLPDMSFIDGGETCRQLAWLRKMQRRG